MRFENTLALPAFLVTAFFLPLALPEASLATDHPTLVSVASAKCDLCHDELLEGKPNVHPPVADDCTICHEFSKTDEGTTVALADSEPPLCIMCHDDKAKAADLDLETPHYPVGDSCLNCHNPHGSENIHLLNAPPGKLCAECHDIDELDEIHGGQLTGATDCASCHVPHGSDNRRMLVASKHHAPFADGSCTGCHREPIGERIRLRARGQRLCIACHGQFPEHETGSKHAALEDQRGRAACLSCHNPHMSQNSALLLEKGNKICGGCHSDVLEAAEADTGHYPASDDCTNCHLPHTSEQTRLLTVPRGELCAECHDLEDGDLAETHLGRTFKGPECLECHSPHGAGNPSVLAEHLHPPIEDGCDTCHEGAYNELIEDGESTLCTMCHDDIEELAAEAPTPHEAMEMAECSFCHNPHASPQEKLVNAPGAGPCAECHDQVAGPDEVAHGVIDLIGCRACHEPHGGENEKLLRDEPNRLCMSCHVAGPRTTGEGEATLLGRFEIPAEGIGRVPIVALDDGKSGHPIPGHRTIGVPTEKELKATDANFREELGCMTCHDPHKGRSAKILRWDAESAVDVCLHCHTK